MKRKWVPVLAGVLACSFLLAGCQGTDKDNGEDEANEPKPEAVMEVADAKLSEGGLDGYESAARGRRGIHSSRRCRWYIRYLS